MRPLAENLYQAAVNERICLNPQPSALLLTESANVERYRVETIGLTQFALLLNSVPHIGEKAMRRLLHLLTVQNLTPEAFLALPEKELKKQFELRPQAAAHLVAQRENLLSASAELLRTVRARNLHVLTTESPSYPYGLERYDDAPPPILYALGNLRRLDANFTFAVATSNGATVESLLRQDAIVAALAEAGGIVITGHDRTPYQRAALAAQRINKPIVYVFDRGLREALGPELDRPPFAAARIRDAVFDPERDLALSPFRLDDHAIGANLRRRDRLIFALADVVIAHDAQAGGGMAAECLRVLEQKRKIFVSPGGRSGNEELRAVGCPALPENAAEIAPKAAFHY